MKSLKQLDKEAEFRFFGGDLMKSAGGILVKHYREMAFMGIIPVIMNSRTILKNLSICKKDIADYKPDEKDREQIKAAYQELGLDCLVCIGGNGTQRTTYMLSQLGLNVIGVPKTIDNDVYGTDVTFGFDTAVNIATDAIDRLHSTASSHRRVMVIELMGHHAGWITLYAGMAGGADIILLPELGYNMKVIIDKINKRMELGKAYSIVAVAEGVELPTKERPATYFAREIEEQTGYETRETVLGYIQRGGSPSPSDKILGTLLGGHAADLIHEGKFGRMVAKLGNKISDVPLSEVEGKLRLITPDTDLVVQGKKMGISFGVW
jgi:6-phosphofructokinase